MNYMIRLRLHHVLLACLSFILAEDPAGAQTPCSPVPAWVESTQVAPGTDLTLCQPWAEISVSVIYTNEPCADAKITQWTAGSYTFTFDTNSATWVKSGFNTNYDFFLDDTGTIGMLIREPDASPCDVPVEVTGIKEWWIHTCPIDNPTYYSSPIDIKVHFTIDNHPCL